MTDTVSFRTITSAEMELEQLRTFKAMALEKYPDLEPKPETDEEVGIRLFTAWDSGESGVTEIILAAIKWARSNPRPMNEEMGE